MAYTTPIWKTIDADMPTRGSTSCKGSTGLKYSYRKILKITYPGMGHNSLPKYSKGSTKVKQSTGLLLKILEILKR
jgi:hypothetical protein